MEDAHSGVDSSKRRRQSWVHVRIDQRSSWHHRPAHTRNVLTEYWGRAYHRSSSCLMMKGASHGDGIQGRPTRCSRISHQQRQFIVASSEERNPFRPIKIDAARLMRQPSKTHVRKRDTNLMLKACKYQNAAIAVHAEWMTRY